MRSRAGLAVERRRVMAAASRVLLLRNFAEDRRLSMEVYADQLFAALRRRRPRDFDFAAYRPALRGATRRLPELLNLRMRAARYIDYPSQAGRQHGDVRHVLDHAYAHVLRAANPKRTVVTVHDLTPILAGRGMIPGIRRPRRSWLAEWTSRYYRRAAALIAVSENTKRDLVAHCGCEPSRIRVVNPGIDPGFRELPTTARALIRQRHGIAPDQKVVLITGHQYYKNQATSMAVFARVRAQLPAALLVRVGRTTAAWRSLLRASGLAAHVVELDHVAAHDMPGIYNVADCLLFPSWYEGFGLPPVEAMACGTPVVASNAGALPESAGQAAILLPPHDVDALAGAVVRVLDDDTLRRRQVAAGRAHAARFSWDATADGVLDVYRSVIA